MDNRFKAGKISQYHVDTENPNSFIVARLVHRLSEGLLLSVLTPSGVWDGFLYLNNNAIGRIDSDEEYIQRLLTLSKLKGQVEPRELYTVFNSFKSIIDYSVSHHLVIGIECYESGGIDLTGMIAGYDECFLEILQMDDYGQTDGYAFVRPEAVTRMCFMTEQMHDIELLSGIKP